MSKRSSKAANARDRAANGAAPRTAAGPLRLIAANATPEEAAAIVAALARFMRATAPPPGAPAQPLDPWWRAGMLEGVERDAPGELREPWLGA
jgi:hypothetical protein